MRTATGSASRLWAKIASLTFAVTLIGSSYSVTAPTAFADEDGTNTTAGTISEGTVTWGLKKSWRDYMAGSGTQPLDDATQNASGEFVLPIRTGSYDPESSALTLKLDGRLKFTGYCDDSGYCTLDSEFKDFVVTITQTEQTIRATHIGRDRDATNTDKVTEENALIGELNITGTDPSIVDGTTTWNKIPAIAGPGLRLYSTGTALDDLSINYTGQGGKPDIGEHWTPEGTPLLHQGVKSAPGNDYTATRVLAFSQKSDVLHQAKIVRQTAAPFDFDLTFTTYDPTSLESVGTPRVVNIPSTSGPDLIVHYAPDLDAFFYVTAGNTTEGSVYRITYNKAQKAFDDPELISTYARVTDSTTHKTTGIYWDQEAQKLIVTGSARIAGPSFSEFVLVLSHSAGNWTLTTHNLSAAYATAGGTLNTNTMLVPISGFDARRIQKLANDVYVFAVNCKDKDKMMIPALSLDLRSGSLEVDLIEGSLPPLYFNMTMSYADVHPGTQNEVVLSSSRGAPRRIAWVNNKAAVVSPPEAASEAMPFFQGYVYDRNNEVGYSSLSSSNEIRIYRGDALLGNLVRNDTINRASNDTITISPSGTLYVSTNEGNTAGIQRIELQGISPTVTETPSSQSVKLSGNESKTVIFSAAAIGAPTPTIQWQYRRNGAIKFENIQGANSGTLKVDATVTENGYEYRAVLTNLAGEVATAPVTLTVTASPVFTSEPTSITTEVGRAALFTASVSGSPTPAIVWETNSGSGWTAADPQAFASEDGTLILRSASEKHNGLKVRAVATNSAGTKTSAAATLTVKAAAQQPITYTGVGLEWTGSHEWQVKPPNGSAANYFSVGSSDGTRATYSAEAEGVKVLQRNASGQTKLATWDTRGAHIQASASGGNTNSSKNEAAQLFQFSNGTAVVQPDGSAEISWPGTVTVNFYDGIVPFTMANFKATISNSGTGTFRADLSGYAGDMSNPDKPKEKVAPRKNVVLATFSKAVLNTEQGTVVTPDYASVKINPPAGASAQERTGSSWGAWPQEFIDFHATTGLAGYFYSTGGTFDSGKAPNKFAIGFNGAIPSVPNTPGNGTGNGSGGGSGGGSNGGSKPVPVPPVTSNPSGTVVEGSLVWGFKKSFVKYIQGGVAQGTITTTDGAAKTSSVFWFGQKSTNWATGKTASTTAFKGGLAFYGHHGELDVKITDIRVLVDSRSQGTLLLKHNGKELEFATLDLAAADVRSTAKSLAYSNVPVNLTEAGTGVFAYNGSSFYAAGTEMDPLSFVVGASATKAPTEVSAPKSTTKKTSGSKDSTKSSEKTNTKKKTKKSAQQGSLTWGVKSSFRSYVAGPIAKGQISTQGGASSLGSAYWFGQSSTTWKPKSSTSTTSFAGSVRFTGHEGILDVTLGNPSIRIDSPTSGTLLISSNGVVKEFAKLSLGSAHKTEGKESIQYSGVPVTLTAAGANTFAYSGSTFYAAGTAMDALSFTIGTTAQSTPGNTGVVAANQKPWKAPATPPARTGISLSEDGPFAAGAQVTATAFGFKPNEKDIKAVVYSKPVVLVKDLSADAQGNVTWTGKLPQSLAEGTHTLTFQGSVNRGIEFEVGKAEARTFEGCTIESARLEWGFKGTFRSYISGGIAKGDWTTSKDVTFSKPAFVWGNGSGAFDPAEQTGGIEFTGQVAFSGHDGLLNTVIAEPTLEFVSEDSAVLYLDVSGLSMEDAFAGNTDNVLSAEQIPFVYLDLTSVEVAADSAGTTFTLTQAPTSITADGYANFPNYETGTEFDPITVKFTVAEDCAEPVVEVSGVATEQPAQPEPQALVEEEGTSVVPWVVGGIALLAFVAAAGLVIARRKNAGNLS